LLISRSFDESSRFMSDSLVVDQKVTPGLRESHLYNNTVSCYLLYGQVYCYVKLKIEMCYFSFFYYLSQQTSLSFVFSLN